MRLLGCLFLFSGINFLDLKKHSCQDSWGFLFFLCFPEEFFTGTWFWRGHRNSVFFRSRIPPDSSGFLFPPKAVWLRPATKEGSLLSKIWTKMDLFNLPHNRTGPWCPLPPSSAGASWPEGEGCQRGRDGTGRGGWVDGGSAGVCRVGVENCNGRCNSRQQTTINNRL